MKALHLIWCMLLLVSCTSHPSNQTTTTPDALAEASFDYLIGHWIRSNDPPGKQTYEHWTKTSDIEYAGLGVTLTERDTTFREDILLVKRADGWKFEVSTPTATQATIFALTTITDTGFTSENPQHDFPKLIRYARSGERLEAMISDGENQIGFSFGRMEEK